MQAGHDEMELAREWGMKWDQGEWPFSFWVGEQSSDEFLKHCRIERSENRLDDSRIRKTIVCVDPDTRLCITIEIIQYPDFPVVEWTLRFQNQGNADTPIISNLQALDVWLEGSRFTLHHATGSNCTADDFEPHATVLQTPLQLVPTGGRGSNGVWPYFNLEIDHGGLILALGWPGQWAASFAPGENALRVCMGQELVHLKLHPGESIRSPLIALQCWQGDRIRAHNLFRRWMRAHNLPCPGGKLPRPLFTPCSSHQYGEMVHADEASQIRFIDRYLEENLQPDGWWMDAGWYPCDDWFKTGTWEIDPSRFPSGFRPITDHAHQHGLEVIVWFEPERVQSGTWLFENHPEWLLSAPEGGDTHLLDLGNSEARSWLIEHIDSFLTREGIDLYRQDFNMDPLAYWRANDPEDRQGITENHHISGYLAYWDALRARHPELLIDSCASGGRRNDLETLRRAVPLLRSDYIFEPIGQQAHTYGLSFWAPYYGTGMNALDSYSFRSAMCCGMIGCWDLRQPDLDYTLLRTLMMQWRQLAPLFLADFYPLTPYSLKNDAWIAWQFDDPEQGRGLIQAFRRDQSPTDLLTIRLHGLDPESRYLLTDLDTNHQDRYSGAELMKNGFAIHLPQKPGASLMTYIKQGSGDDTP